MLKSQHMGIFKSQRKEIEGQAGMVVQVSDDFLCMLGIINWNVSCGKLRRMHMLQLNFRDTEFRFKPVETLSLPNVKIPLYWKKKKKVCKILFSE